VAVRRDGGPFILYLGLNFYQSPLPILLLFSFLLCSQVFWSGRDLFSKGSTLPGHIACALHLISVSLLITEQNTGEE